jgi:predicted component of type VI protein secretion system
MEAALNGPLGRTLLEPTVLTIGSSPDNQLVLHSATVAEHQAEIRPEGQGFSITDLGSASGTIVNGQRLDWNMPRLLNPGDTITIGDTTFTYEADGMPLPHISPARPQDIPLTAEPGRPQGAPLPYAPADTGDYDGDAVPWEHTAYGSGSPPGMQPQQPYGESYSQQPFVPPMYQGSIPGYPGAAPVYAGPATPPAARRRSVWVWIALIIIIVLILGSGAYYYFSRSTPEKTLDAYCQALQTQNYVAAYDQLASTLQNTQTEPQYAGVLQALGKVSSCTHGSANILANTATANLTLVSSGQTYKGTITLLQDNSNNWKINILLTSPALTLNTFCNALKIGDYPSAYSELSSDLKSQHTETQFESDFGGLTCSYSRLAVSGINAAALATFTNTTGASSSGAFTLTEDHSSNNDWKINGIQI